MGCVNVKQELNKPDLDFLIENTEFSKQQIETWYLGFIVGFFLLLFILNRTKFELVKMTKKSDCPSGELTKAKFIEVYQQLFPVGDANKFCGHIFRTFDTDNSGKIDFK
jgi:Ca2+-binding EF-hand superfamily protein